MRKIESKIAKALNDSGVRRVLIGVSGGADSVALLTACSRIAPLLGLHIDAANCNFHLRGEESDRDSTFTSTLCQRLGIKLHRLDYDVEGYIASHPGVSIEMACRELRYSDFFRICSEEHLERVAVAHNADDDMETMLLNLLRGSGSRGLRGMDSDNGRVIRPLLEVSRKEIETYLSYIGQEFIVDSSNLTNHYRRNYIRRDILPLLENRWPGARKSLFRTLTIMKEESRIIEAHYDRQLKELCPEARTMLVYDENITVGSILRFIEPFGGNPAIAEEIMEGRRRQFGNRRWQLSDGNEAELERDRLIIRNNEEQAPEPTYIWEQLEINPGLMAEIKRNRRHDIIYLPHDASAYQLRRPQTGDRIAPLGMKGTRLVSDIISDARLPASRKEAVRVMVRRNDGEIIWVTGLKRSRHELLDELSPSGQCFKCEYMEVSSN